MTLVFQSDDLITGLKTDYRFFYDSQNRITGNSQTKTKSTLPNPKMTLVFQSDDLITGFKADYRFSMILKIQLPATAGLRLN